MRRQEESADKQTSFNDVLDQIKEEKKNIDMDFLNRYLTYKTLDEMVKGLNKSKSKNQNNIILSLIVYNFDYFSKKN